MLYGSQRVKKGEVREGALLMVSSMTMVQMRDREGGPEGVTSVA